MSSTPDTTPPTTYTSGDGTYIPYIDTEGKDRPLKYGDFKLSEELCEIHSSDNQPIFLKQAPHPES